ncbi:MAG: hypothetical protein JNK53_00375 [Phycisphaerae bacterium]|nr:hypothetical protein [Phycisphaerae bacterium]
MRRFCAALAVALAAFAHPSLAQSGGEEPTNVQPVTIIGDGLVAGSDVLLNDGLLLTVGESLLPGDVVIGGALVNVADETKVVIVANELLFLQPGTLLLTLDPSTPGWRCACRCGVTWRVLNVSSADCEDWRIRNLTNIPCIDPFDNTLSQWLECNPVWDVPSYP